MLSDDNKKIITEFFLGMLFLWFLWFISGGASRQGEDEKPFLKPIAPLNTGKDFGEVPKLPALPDLSKSVVIKDEADDTSYPNAKLSLVQNTDGHDYLLVSVPLTSKGSVNITGWQIKSSVAGENLIVGEGTRVFYQGKVNESKLIYLYPGEKALLLPDNSPVGASFKVNKCSGYLAQFQSFYPDISQNCPHPSLDQNGNNVIDYSCQSFLNKIPRCRAYVEDFPKDTAESCKSIANQRFNYNSCVSEHLYNRDFLSGEWRVYLNNNGKLASKNGDIIRIYSKKSTLIDTIFYTSAH